MNVKQLFEKVAKGYIPIYPLASMDNIVDENQSISLTEVLNKYNHIYVTFADDAKETRLLIPDFLRRYGLWLSYEKDGNLYTEFFKGSNVDAQQEERWSGDEYWEYVPDLQYINDASQRIPNGAILPEHLSDSLKQLLSQHHTINNMVDDEDLETKGCGIIKFKDRPYQPNIASGKGYKILRKDFYNGINTLTVEDFEWQNTIYEVRYDFDLQGQTINLPKGATLLFKGGAINNGSVYFNGGTIIGADKFSDCGNATFTGEFSKGLIMSFDDTPKWWNGTEWVAFASGGGEEPSGYEAKVISVETTDNEANATVKLAGKIFNFTFAIPRGKQGPQGIPGPAGSDGSEAISTQTFIVFKSTGQSISTPATPIGGHWNSSINEFTPPSGWSRTDKLEGIVWMSSGIFRADTGELIDEWSTPVRVTGQDGSNGTDGTSIEFIFKLTKTPLEPPYLDTSDSPNTNKYIPNGWTDSPTGISIEYQCEWVSTRRKEESGSWSKWTEPAVWSKWGVDGIDGDGVEYIFFRNNGASVSNPTPSDTNTDQYQEKGDYEGIEYIPAGWTDNPQGVNSNLKYEWVSQRKYRNSVWGKFSDPAVWAKFGDDGYSGLSLRTMYAKENIGETPVVVKNNINPGSIWGTVFPDYNSETEAVWCIQAYVTYDNKLATTEDGAAYEGWQGPWIITGTSGKDSTPPNYKTYVYKKSDTKPSKPTGTDKIPAGWQDYPNGTGQWWQCIGTVNGVTELVTEWSEVLPVNGKDGIAQDGKKTEFRFAVHQSATTPPVLNIQVRNPDGWSTQPPTVNSGYYLWMTSATIDPDDTLSDVWSTPVRISGEKGPQGDTGPAGKDGVNGSQGAAGIPGVDIEVRFSLGTDTTYDATWNNSVKTIRNPISYGWALRMPKPTDLKPYIWLIQARIVHQVNGDTGTLESSWSEPLRLNGINGLPGPQGKKGQVIYPAGVYGNTVSYTTTETKAPYVYDPSDGNFYVLNAIMTWLGTEQNNRTPSQDYAQNNGTYWLKFDAFEAIYTKIGIIANGLIGSAVFNGDYMFSQQGINPSSSNAVTTTDYENFDKDHIYDGTFTPNIMFNFATGAGHFGAGKIKLGSDGNCYLGDSVSISNDGKVSGNMFIGKDFDFEALPHLNDGEILEFKRPYIYATRVLYNVDFKCANTNDRIFPPVQDDTIANYPLLGLSGKVTFSPPMGVGFIHAIGEGSNSTTNWYIGVSSLSGSYSQ